ncbi:unnamed protein product, partial [Symbiodinium natans]
MLLENAVAQDVQGGSSLQMYWRMFDGFIVQEDALRRHYLPVNRSLQSMARSFLTVKNAASFFVHGPGRFLSSQSFWQFVRTFPVDLQWEICLALGENKLLVCALPVAVAEPGVSGHLVHPPLEDVELALLSLSLPLRQQLLHYLDLWDLARAVSTCAELQDVIMNSDSWKCDSTLYLRSLPSQIFFAASPTYHLNPTAYASLRSVNPLQGHACIVMSWGCQVDALVIGVTNAFVSRMSDAEVQHLCSCTITAPFQTECKTCIRWTASKQPPIDVSCPFLVADRCVRVLDLAWQQHSLRLKVDGRTVRSVDISCVGLQRDAYVFLYSIGEQVCKDNLQMAFAERRREHVNDLAGGSDALKPTDPLSCLSQSLQREVIINIATTRELLCLRACSKSASELLREDSLLRGSVVDLRDAGAQAFRPGSAFSFLMAVLAQAKVIKLQYRHIHAVPPTSTSRVLLEWSGHTFLRRESDFCSWRALHPVYQRASLDIAVSSDIRTLVLGIKNLVRNSVRWLNVCMEWNATYFAVFLDDVPLCHVDTWNEWFSVCNISRYKKIASPAKATALHTFQSRSEVHVSEPESDEWDYNEHVLRAKKVLASTEFSTFPATPVLTCTPVIFDVEHLKVPPIFDHLSILHSHERDQHLVFQEEGHRYYWKNESVNISVTGLIHLLTGGFKEQDVIRSMRQGSNWPRAAYVKPYASLELLQILQQIPGTEQLVSLLQQLPHDRAAVANLVRSMIYSDAVYNELADIVSMTSSEICHLWAQARRVGAARGTWMHAQIECLLNGGCVTSCSLEVAKFLRFVAEGGFGNNSAFRTEWKIYASEESLAGSIDFVARAPDGALVLFDWKRANKLCEKHNSFGKFMKSPMHHVPDASLWHYRLQLNLYKFILERYYNLRVVGMHIVSFHPDSSTFVDKVPDMQAEANAIMTYQRNRLANQAGEKERDFRGGAAAPSQASEADSFTQRIEQEFEDALVPSPECCRVGSSGRRDHVAKILEIDDAFLLNGVVPDLPQSQQGSILHDIQEVQELVAAHSDSSSWPEPLQHVVQGAISVHRLRLLDISRREEVLFLELIEGSSRHVRAHNGQCFFLSEHGHWAVYNGVIPQGVLARCKKFLLFLEGLYRLLPTGTLRTPDSIIRAVSVLLQGRNDNADFLLQECERAAICGNPHAAKRRKTRADVENENRDDSEDENKPWTQAGFCTLDACLVFEKEKGLQQLQKAGSNNIYTFLPHRLLDPVPDDVKQRVQHFWYTTYWNNGEAFDCFMSALTLAIRGENVDRAFWGIGSGGVGQSLQTAHLEAILGSFHACLDMNIYYSDEEMRKQAASLLGKLVVTGQESVQGSRRGMREDVYKKHMSADKLPERLPYAIETRLVELRGWKRFEFNMLPRSLACKLVVTLFSELSTHTFKHEPHQQRFFGISEETFNSLFRRSLAVRYKALFLELKDTTNQVKEPEKKGIFPKDPTLKDFLRSKPACLVTLRAVWNYACRHSAADCRSCLEDYVVGKKDEGLTEACVREACGLKPPDTSENRDSSRLPGSVTSDLPETDGAGQEVDPEVLRLLQQQADEIEAWMIDVNKDWCTPSQIKTVKGKHFWKAFSRQDAENILKALADNKLMLQSTLTLQKQGLTEIFAPQIHTEKSMKEVVNMDHHGCTVFPEVYDCEALRQHMLEHKGRLANDKVLLQAHKKRLNDLKKSKASGAGAPTKVQRTVQENQENMIQTMGARLRMEQQLFDDMQKCVEQDVELLEMVMQRTYSYKLQHRCRRMVDGFGAQSFSRVFRNIVCKNTRDFDFHASMFTIVVQMVDKLGVAYHKTLKDLAAWRAVAKTREKVCAEILQCSQTRGKALLLQVACGRALSSADDICETGQKFLHDLSKESRCLRWLARSQCPDLYLSAKDGAAALKQSSWPEATVFAYWWNAAEDLCLSSILDLVADVEVSRKHISLHFDGVLLSTEIVQAVQEKNDMKSFPLVAEAAIFERTGFQITITEKRFRSLAQRLSELEGTSLRVDAADETMLTLLSSPGNCIPFAYACVTQAWRFVEEALRTVNQANTRAEQGGYRCYKDWTKCNQRFLRPCFTLPSLPGTDFLVHANVGSAPQCFGAKVLPDKQLQVFHERKVYMMPAPALQEILDESCEACSIVFFCVQSTEPTAVAGEQQLLDLVAGASSKDRMDSQAGASGAGSEATEADVQVGMHLRELLKDEVKNLIAKVQQNKGSSFGSQVCPLCPWRRFDKRSYLLTHLTKHHSESKRFVASGTKQLRIIAAMYDDDAARKAVHGNYIQRAAELLRCQVKPGCSSKRNIIDKEIRMCLSAKGPYFMSLSKIKAAKDLRRVGNVYYNQGFANEFMCNAVASRASFRQIAAAFTSSSARDHGALCSMLPEASHSFWCNVLEDIVQSPQIKSRVQTLLQECEDHTEFQYLSIDAHFNSSQDVRDAAAITDSEAAYKLLTVRGRTNAVVGLCGVRSEGSPVISTALASLLSPSQRAQVIHIASDAPSVELLATLKNTFSNLQSLGLDAMHIVMVYEQNFSNKKTTGSRWLATVMNKFRNIQAGCPAAAWGPMYTGQQKPSYTAEEKRLSALISDASMPEAEAVHVLQNLDPDSPWRTEAQFLEAMAAICALFQDELTKTTFSGPTLHRLLINLTSPVKIQWLFNDTRYRHVCLPSQTPLLPSGTTSNETPQDPCANSMPV